MAMGSNGKGCNMTKEYITLEIAFTKEFLEEFHKQFENQYGDWDGIPYEAYQVLQAAYEAYDEWRE